MRFFNQQYATRFASVIFPQFTYVRANGLRLGLYSAVTAGTAYGLYTVHYESQREHEITSVPFDDKSHQAIKEADNFIQGNRPAHGSLHSHVVTEKNTGIQFIKKGAHSPETLQKEYMYSRLLNAAFPNSQPTSYFMQVKLDNGEARFYTLSEKFPNTMDVEEFIRQPNWEALVLQKPVKYLDRTLALDGLLAKQQDSKYANYVIREFDSHYEIITIDHEYAFGTKFSKSAPLLTDEPNKLIDIISDLQNPDPDRVIGLQGDKRAFQFVVKVQGEMTSENIHDTYQRIAEADTKPVIDQCRLFAASGTLFAMSDCDHYEKKFEKIKQMAHEHNEQHRLSNNRHTK